MRARFSAPVVPGETIRTEMWRNVDGNAVFRSRVVERNLVVLDQGIAEIHSDARVVKPYRSAID
jgi:acyl dehydratase